MRMKLSSLSLRPMLRWTAATLSLTTMILSPVALGADSARRNKESIQEFMKVTGLADTKNMTIGDFYYRMQLWIPAEIKGDLKAWAVINKDKPMPKVEVQPIKDQLGQEQYRIVMQLEGQSMTLETGDGFVKIGSTKLTGKDYYNVKKFQEKLFAQQPYLAKSAKGVTNQSLYSGLRPLNVEEFSRMTPEQRAVYFYHLRRAVEEAQKVLGELPADLKTSFLFTPKKNLFIEWLLGQRVEAQEETVEPPAPAAAKPKGKKKQPATAKAARTQIPVVGDSCIVAGYKSTYGENKSCGGLESGRANFMAQINASFKQTFPRSQSCKGTGYPCNPLVYGFKEGGQPYCISKASVKDATSLCNQESPLKGNNDHKNKQRIVQSWVKAMGKEDQLEFNADGKVKASQYGLIEKQLGDLQTYIKDAVGFCDSAEGKALSDKRPDQKDACDAIRVRAFALDSFSVEPADQPLACADIPGSVPRGGKCVCESPYRESNEGGALVCIPAPTADVTDDRIKTKPDPKDDEECTIIGFSCKSALIGVGVLGGLGLLAWWLWPRDKKKDPPPYVPPVPPVCPSTNPLCDPPPVCNTTTSTGATNCPPPPPPPPPPNTEGGTGDSPIIVAPPGRR